MVLLNMPGLTALLFMIFTAFKGRAVELATTAVNVVLLLVKEFSCYCAHYCRCFCPCSSSSEPPLYARAIYDFMARNGRELSVTKGDVVQVRLAARAGGVWSGSPAVCALLITPVCSALIKQVVKRSNHWWLIRSRGDEGSVPQNVLELINGSSPVEDQQVSRAEPSRAKPRPAALRTNFIPFALRHSGTPAGPSPWTWTPRPRRSRPGWSTKASPKCEWKVWRLGLFTREKLTGVVAARWTRWASWRVSCCWGWPRRRSGPCVQKRAAKSSSSCRASNQPWQWVRSHDTRAHALERIADVSSRPLQLASEQTGRRYWGPAPAPFSSGNYLLMSNSPCMTNLWLSGRRKWIELWCNEHNSDYDPLRLYNKQMMKQTKVD